MAATTTSPAIHTNWALFDPTVITEEATIVPTEPTTAAACATSDGHGVRVSLRLADPPAASFVEMRTDAELRGTPTLVSADGSGLLLILAAVVVRDDDPFSHQEYNFFVYKAHPSSPSLRLLPHPNGCDLYTGIVARRGVDGKDDNQEQEVEEFVAAAFRAEIIGGDEVGKLTRFSSSTGKCEVLNLSIPFDPSKGLYKLTWETDKVVPFGDLMCFVDYHRGILLCNVFDVSPELRFVPLPEIEVWDDTHDYYNGRRLPQAHRTVGVSQGALKFVDVSDGLFGRRRHSFGVTITMWTLRTTTLVWEKDAVLKVDDLWSFPEFRSSSPMPRWMPGLPAVCRNGPDIVHFAMREPKFSANNAWVMMVDLRQMELLAYEPYTNQAEDQDEQEYEDDEEFGWKKVVGCLFYDRPLICCDVYN